MRYDYHFAGMDFLVEMPDELCYRDHRRLAPFQVDAVTEPHCFSYTLTEELPAPEGACIAAEAVCRVYREGDARVQYIGSVTEGWELAYMRAEHRGKQHRVQIKRYPNVERLGVHTVLNAMQPEQLITEVEGFLFHSALIEYEGAGILFTAPSGTGKSTQAELWKKFRGARIINGDRSAVRITEKGVLAEGIPFCGSSEYCENASLPLKAIVYLQQAPETTICRIGGYQAFRRIWEGCSVNTWDSEHVQKVSGTVERVLRQVPVYLLSCTPDESAVMALEKMLGE